MAASRPPAPGLEPLHNDRWSLMFRTGNVLRIVAAGAVALASTHMRVDGPRADDELSRVDLLRVHLRRSHRRLHSYSTRGMRRTLRREPLLLRRNTGIQTSPGQLPRPSKFLASSQPPLLIFSCASP